MLKVKNCVPSNVHLLIFEWHIKAIIKPDDMKCGIYSYKQKIV